MLPHEQNRSMLSREEEETLWHGRNGDPQAFHSRQHRNSRSQDAIGYHGRSAADDCDEENPLKQGAALQDLLEPARFES